MSALRTFVEDRDSQAVNLVVGDPDPYQRYLAATPSRGQTENGGSRRPASGCDCEVNIASLSTRTAAELACPSGLIKRSQGVGRLRDFVSPSERRRAAESVGWRGREGGGGAHPSRPAG
jgi:hypothetical protein